MDDKSKITLQFILDNTNTETDLRWKLGKFIKNGDTSYLGTIKSKELNEKLEENERN
jgi:hypothetical protein